jgi:FAD/FMN-containing dehydrogenase
VDGEWRNWSGGLAFRPGDVLRPASEAQVADLVVRAEADGVTVRPVGAGHSSAPLVETSGWLVSLDRLPVGVLGVGPGDRQATLGAGTRLCDLEDALREHRLAMENLGDVDTQVLAGAVSTGTHGSGRGLGNLSTQVVGVRMVTGGGRVVQWSQEEQPDLMRAGRLTLGLLGIITAVRLRVLPAFRAVRREWCMGLDECLHELDRLHHTHRNMDFYWYPRRDEVKVRTVDPVHEDPGAPSRTECTEYDVDWSGEVLARTRTLRFHEMEYAVPAEAGRDCFAEVRRRMLQRHRRHVAWRVLYRFVAGDDNYLSPAHGRDCVTISLHQNVSLPYDEFFGDLEPVLRAHDGRPHWAKIHTWAGGDLLQRYPEAETFLKIRRELDPQGVFLNDHLRRLFAL